MMHGMVLAATKIPLASLLDDAAPAQQHKGWEYGYLDGFANQTRTLNHLSWKVSRFNPHPYHPTPPSPPFPSSSFPSSVPMSL